MSRPFQSRFGAPSQLSTRINGKIRAREVRVIGSDGTQVGILPLAEAINLARTQGVDLVEIAPNATPPVCRIVDFGKFRYEQSKKEKESKKHQQANRLKEVQLSASIDPHDFSTKVNHGIGFLCDDMSVKISLRFRGREMAHTEFGIQVVKRYIQELAPWGQAAAEPKLQGRNINLMINPLPRNKRAAAPREDDAAGSGMKPVLKEIGTPLRQVDVTSVTPRNSGPRQAASETPSGFTNSPFSSLKVPGEGVGSQSV